MGTDWKKEYSISYISASANDYSLFGNFATNNESHINFNETKSVDTSSPPAKYIEKYKEFCIKRNARYTGRPKNIKKWAEKYIGAYNKTLEAVRNLAQNSLEITTQTVINQLNAKDLTDGNLQRTILSIMVCNGKLKKKRVDKEDGKFMYIYVFTGEKNLCPYLKDGKCSFNWKKEAIRDYGEIKTPHAKQEDFTHKKD